MSQIIFSPEDPKFTAYALGELEGKDRAAIESALRDNPAARAMVDEIRGTAARLSAALATEAGAEPNPAPAISAHDAANLPDTNARKLGGNPRERWGKLLHFPQVYYVVGGLAAACFAVFVALREPLQHPAKPAEIAKAEGDKTYVKMDVAFLPAEAPAASMPVSETTSSVPITAPTASRLQSELLVSDANLAPAKNSLALLEQVKAENSGTTAGELRSLGPISTAGLAGSFGRPAGVTSQQAAGGISSRATARDSITPLLPKQVTASAKIEKISVGRTASAAATGDAVITLSPFEASVSPEKGYFTATTMAGSRIDAEAKGGRVGGGSSAASMSAQKSVALGGYEVSVDKDSVNRMTGITVAGIGAARLLDGGSPDHYFAGSSKPAAAESYAYQKDSDFLAAAQNPFSTFAIDVDTASYANVRRFIESGRLPPADAVRIEEMLNYFPYRYPAPTGEAPFAAMMEVASAPWAPTHRLVRIGLKGREVSTEARPAANLVFLLDVSGSMNEPNKLPLVKESMRLLIGKLRADDRVAIVTYAGQSGLALASTPVARSREILAALDSLSAGGSTNGAMGIQLAYDVAKAHFVPGGLNRVILCTDGDFNVGVTSEGELTRLIEEKAKSGVFLTVLGFGMGNLKDATLEQLADKGNGNYGYIDTRHEAEKLLVEQVNGTLLTIAKDVKLQVDFNPAKVASYRLLGYEDRTLQKEDFNNDNVDAGEIGAGHTVTALYEIVPVGAEEKNERALPAVDESKYQAAKTTGPGMETKLPAAIANELLTLKVRYKEPTAEVSQKLEFPLVDGGAQFASASPDFKFAAAVAGFGMILRGSPHKGNVTIGDIIAWAGSATDDDANGYRGEFITLVNSARTLLR